MVVNDSWQKFSCTVVATADVHVKDDSSEECDQHTRSHKMRSFSCLQQHQTDERADAKLPSS